MSTENEAFNIDTVIENILEPSSPEAPAVVEAPVELENEATPEAKEALLSPQLAERSKREREARAEIEALRGTQDEAITAARAEAAQELIDQLFSDTAGFIEQYGKERAGELAMKAYAVELGEEAPDDLKQEIGMSEMERFKSEQTAQFEQFKLQLEQEKNLARDQATIEQYKGYLSDIPTDLPYLATEVEHDAHEVLTTMAQIADHAFQRDGKYPTASEVAKTLDREIASQLARHSKETPPAVQQKPLTDQVTSKQTQTLSTDHSGSAAKKLPSGEDELFADALAMFEEMTAR